jgi:hypothetical protein
MMCSMNSKLAQVDLGGRSDWGRTVLVARRRRVLQDEIHDRLRIFQTVGMMITTWFHDYLHVAAKRGIARRGNFRVLFVWDCLIRVANYRENWNPRFGERREVIEWI